MGRGLGGNRDLNGKDGRHGGTLACFRRWAARNVKVTTLAVVASVALLATLTRSRTPDANHRRNSGAVRIGQAAKSQVESTIPGGLVKAQYHVPPCPSAPWKEPEILHGTCPGDLKPFDGAKTITECATTCCENPSCISWQFRSDVGCKQGGDVRIGMEKDGVPAWCDSNPPQKWSGQFLYPKGKTEGMDAAKLREDGCSFDAWNPEEQVGQCFGLGPKREEASGSAEDCMAACCAVQDSGCGVWQWSKDIGCFYGRSGFSCKGDGDPIHFEPFVGKRKRLEGRSYTDKDGKPWSMTMPE